MNGGKCHRHTLIVMPHRHVAGTPGLDKCLFPWWDLRNDEPEMRPSSQDAAEQMRRSIPRRTKEDPNDWIAGDSPMTGARGSYLETRLRRMQRAGQFPPGLHQGR
jgi:Protein of unknown function (DUF3072)